MTWKCGSSLEATLELQLDHVAQLDFLEKGNEDMQARRIFSDDELEYFARALVLYGDMGWPMDYAAIGDMMCEAAKEAGRIDYMTGKPFIIGPTYVAAFVKARPELAAFRASNIDPLRAKKGTAQVCAQSAERCDRVRARGRAGGAGTGDGTERSAEGPTRERQVLGRMRKNLFVSEQLI